MEISASKRVLKNFGIVLRGRGIAAIFTLVATALMAHALSATEFGLVILLHTYVLAVRGFLNFRTYEAIVRFGVPMHENDDGEGLKQLFRITTLVDLTSAIVATLVGVLAASVAGSLLHWDAQMISLAGLYSLVMLTTVINTPNGILRLYDRFDALSVFYTVGPSVRIVGVLIAWSMDASMFVYIGIWAAAFVLENTWLYIRGHLEFRKHLEGRLWQGGSWQEIRGTSPEFRHFIAVVYWQTNIDLMPKHLAVLLAGSLLGPAAAGMFRLARDFSSILSKPAMMLREVLFPDLARILHTRAEGFRELGFRAVIAAGAVGMLLVLFSIPAGGPILGVIGPEYTVAAPLLTLMLLAATFELASSPLRAATYAMGKVGPVLRIHLISVLVYFGLFYLLTPVLGLEGPGIAACIGALLTLLLMFRMVQKP
ncbi:MAG: oligosaccharide flippase family protein [Gammaproteobacteria bacterium]|nr:oligosaccharide flippase family protein [Gammaproteobacteria bacterium]